jgi:cobalt-zinc-cadmium efflux system membrane fusion protein
MSRARLLISCCIAAVCGMQTGEAHEGEEHHEAASPAVTTAGSAIELPHRLANGDLYIPKSVQRLLGIRTEILSAEGVGAQIQLQGEIAARPEKHVITFAPQAGLLEAPEGGWPLPGATVKGGAATAPP